MTVDSTGAVIVTELVADFGRIRDLREIRPLPA